jgi:hypothetical protein
MKTDKELKIIMMDLQDWLHEKDLKVLEATVVLEMVKLGLNFQAFEKSLEAVE